MELSKFILENSPLAVAVAHVRLTQTPEIESRISELRGRFKSQGLPIFDQQQQANLVVSTNQPLVTKTRNAWHFFDPAESRGATVTTTSCTYFTTSYASFDSFLAELNPVIQTLVDVCEGAFFSLVGLRYLNLFAANSLPTDLINVGLRGMSVDGIDTKHFHHEYRFWCDTGDGNLVVKCKLDHGNRIPEDLGFASRICRPKFDYKTHVYQLDIYENTRPIRPQAELAVDLIGQYTSRQHENIERAFLNCVTDDALREWGKREK